MKQYKFSMEKVLNLRQSQEDDAKKDYLEKKLLQLHEEEKLEKMVKASQDLKETTHSFGTVNELRQQYLYKNYLDEQIKFQESEVALAERNTHFELSIFVEKQKRRKMMERLKEKKYESFKEEERKEEQKELDEMGILRFKSKTI